MFYSNFAYANTGIVFIDMDKVITISKPGASIIKQLEELSDKKSQNFKKLEKEIKEKESKVIAQKNILSTEDFQKKIDLLRMEVKNYNKNKNDTLKELNKTKIFSTNKFLQLINPIITAYSEEKAISLILQKKNLIIAKNDLDITNEIITIINEKIKEFKIE